MHPRTEEGSASRDSTARRAKRTVRIGAWAVTILMTVVVLSLPAARAATAGGYSFTPLATLGTLAPGGGQFIFDFEPWAINDAGQVAFAADYAETALLPTEAVYVWQSGHVAKIVQPGDPAPGGGTFDGPVLGDTALNSAGDMAFAYTLSPGGLPVGVNAGVFRFSQGTQTLSAIMLPGVTSAPGGGTFAGANFRTSLNRAGQVAFAGIVATPNGIHVPGEDYVGLGTGVYLVGTDGTITSIVSPGDPAPGGGTFDFAHAPWINDRGDVVFDAHVAGEECIEPAFPQSIEITCFAGVYLWNSRTRTIQPIARMGDPAPGGGTIRSAFWPRMNAEGDIVFAADLTLAPGALQNVAVFEYTHGTIVPVIRPGDAMPGGGHVTTAFSIAWNWGLNEHGDITFNAFLDTDVNGDGIPDSGTYVWSQGSVQVVARTGTVIPDLGTVVHVTAAGDIGFPVGGAVINNRGQVSFQAVLEDGRDVLLLATPPG